MWTLVLNSHLCVSAYYTHGASDIYFKEEVEQGYRQLSIIQDQIVPSENKRDKDGSEFSKEPYTVGSVAYFIICWLLRYNLISLMLSATLRE